VICWPQGEPKPDVEAAKQYLNEQVAKPEVVRELEGLLGVPAHQTGSKSSDSWGYSAPWDKSTWDDSIWKLANENNGKSYFNYWYAGGTIGVDIRWIRNLSDIRNVELDLSPIEKVLNWKFHDQPGQVQEIMDYAWQVAEKTRSSDGTERLPWKYFYVGDYKVAVGSVGFNFVGVIISKV